MPSVPSSSHSNRFPSRFPPNRLNLYFPPGGHTHERHAIPPDRLHISFSDPVLVAAEQRLSGVPVVPIQQIQPKPSTIKDAQATATRAIKLGSVAIHHLRGRIFSHKLRGHDNDPAPIGQTLKMPTTNPGPNPARYLNADVQATTTHDPSSLNSLDDSYDICEVVTVPTQIDGAPGNGDDPASENSLAPLASELFKEELYIRGYLKRPASRPPNDITTVPRKSVPGLMLVSHKVFPKVLGRRQGHKVAECLKAEQDAAETPANGLDAHQSENQLRTPHADGQQSPGTGSNTSASETFDLHEFSYITAFTTPPSSPSTVLDGETSKKAVSLGESKHTV